MAKDPEFMQQLEYVWTKLDTDRTWEMLFSRMLQVMDREELKDFMRTAYAEYTAEEGLGQFANSSYRLSDE